MRIRALFACLPLLIAPIHLRGDPQLTTWYNSLDPFNISQLLAFYELYPNTVEGKQALKRSWSLLGSSNGQLHSLDAIQLTPQAFSSIVNCINKTTFTPSVNLTDQELFLIDQLSNHLYNRRLKGHTISSEEECLNLPSEEIDLARGLLLSQLAGQPDKIKQVRYYEAMLDLMALQVLALLQPYGSLNAPPLEKINKLNQFIFKELRFRFPPHSLYAADIDLYTFLPSVMDSRRGVCLGVSLLYMSVAQRIGLPLQAVTPPGHIFLRYQGKEGERNIETTARGIHLPSETYLGINTCQLKRRSLKEMIGMAHFNQASVFSQQQKYAEAVSCYQKALPYLIQDPLVKELLAYHLFFVQREEEGRALLLEASKIQDDCSVVQDWLAPDYLNGKVDAEGIQAICLSVDETRESILNKQKKLEESVNKFPEFREGLFQLATTQLQMNQFNQALDTLERLHQLDSSNPTVEYYLAALCIERADYPKAWHYFRNAEQITKQKEHSPQALKELYHELRMLSPEFDGLKDSSCQLIK